MDPVKRSEYPVRKRHPASIHRVDGARDRDRRAEIVEMRGQATDELAAMTTMRKVLLRLALLLGIGETSRIGFEDRLSVRAPFPAFNEAHLLEQLIDTPGDLLTVGTRRKAPHQATHLLRL